MAVSARIVELYAEAVPHVRALRGVVAPSIEMFCRRGEFHFVDRIKTLESVAEKLESGRYSSFTDLDDLYAIAIVVLTLNDVDAVLQWLRHTFDVVSIKRRLSTPTDPDVFRFDCVRFYGRLNSSEELELSPLLNLVFEVQVRTAFEHAWCVVTHGLTYKSATVSWETARLSATLRAIVEQVDLTVVGFEDVARRVHRAKWERGEALSQISKEISAFFDRGELPDELRPQAWSRFVDNVYSLIRAEAIRRESNSRPRQSTLRRIQRECIEAIRSWIQGTAASDVPRSLSLYQIFYGVVVSGGAVDRNINYRIFGIEDIVALFPSVAPK